MIDVINTFDIDGVIHMGQGRCGLRPGPCDIIITGRCEEERPETKRFLERFNIFNPVFFNDIDFDLKTRELSGHHKAETLLKLQVDGFNIQFHYEDDPVQADIIRRYVPDIEVIIVQHDLTEKENVRHTDD